MNYIQVSSVSAGAETAAISALRSVLSSEGASSSFDGGAAILDQSASRLSDECTHLIVGARLRKTEKVGFRVNIQIQYLLFRLQTVKTHLTML